MINTYPTRPSRPRISLTAALLAIMLFPTALVNALPGDREKPIHITADKAVRDEQKGVTVYSGHVQMRQGSMELDADSLTIYHDAENADQIVARGNPAKMRQQPKPEDALVHAHASIITYFKSEDRVHLQTDARIEQAGDLVTGDSIDYLITKQLITAESDKSLAGDKVNVVLQPTVATSQPDATAPVAPETAVEPTDTTDPSNIEEGTSGTTESE
jgi:lipopolysaccharide export system protein LptA